MKNTKNKIRSGVLALTLAVALCAFTAVPAFAASGSNVDPHAGVEYQTIQTPVDESMPDFVQTLTMLTEAEKQQLIDESVAAQPIIDRIAELENQILVITDQVLLDAENLFKERGDIFDAHEALWEKLWSNLNDAQLEMDDDSAIIRASDVLTASEKETLLKAQARLDVLEAGIDVYYAKADEDTKDLTAQRDQAIEQLQELYAKTAHIWDKVYAE